MMKDYVRNNQGMPQGDNPDNFRFLLKGMMVEIRFNAWLERIEIKSSEWAPQYDEGMFWSEWTVVNDSIVSKIKMHGARTHNRLVMADSFVAHALVALAMANTVDPAIDALTEMQKRWDGQPRLDNWLHEICGTPADAYHAAVSRNIIGGMVRRIRNPGCKHDTVPLLISEEGKGKSTLAAALSPNRDWFADTIQLGDESKELVLALAGKCVVEISELSASTRDVAKIKAMLSRQIDAGRTAYGRFVTDRPRRNIFIASTNDETALVSDTGNRRFLPVRIAGEINLEKLRADLPQLIGEAAMLERTGDAFQLPRDVWNAASLHQESARQVATHELYLNEWFAPIDLHTFVTAADLATLVKSVAPGTKVGRYLKTMRALGFIEGRKIIEGKTAAVWHRGDIRLATRVVPRTDGGIMHARLMLSTTTATVTPPLPVTAG
jgi:predicted P-loop ATPase